jgi:hypothetical protein
MSIRHVCRQLVLVILSVLNQSAIVAIMAIVMKKETTSNNYSNMIKPKSIPSLRFDIFSEIPLCILDLKQNQ